jgi:hypothetical protein
MEGIWVCALFSMFIWKLHSVKEHACRRSGVQRPRMTFENLTPIIQRLDTRLLKRFTRASMMDCQPDLEPKTYRQHEFLGPGNRLSESRAPWGVWYAAVVALKQFTETRISR